MQNSNYYERAHGWLYNKYENSIQIYSTTRNKSYYIDLEYEMLVFNFFERVALNKAYTKDEIRKLIFVDTNNAAEFIETLIDIDIIIEFYSCNRNDRQYQFWKLYETNELYAHEINENIKNTRIGIIGVGGMGSWILLHCATLGIKEISIVDPDLVESSNLNRQILFSKNDIGRKKVEVASEYILNRFDNIKIRAYDKAIESSEDCTGLLTDIDFLFIPFGIPSRLNYFTSTVKKLIDFCEKKDISCVICGSGLIGPILIGDHNKKMVSFYEDTNISIQLENLNKTSNLGFLPSLSPRVSLHASFAVWEAVRFLGNSELSKVVNKIYWLDSFNYENIPQTIL